jgi:hypothetical protein
MWKGNCLGCSSRVQDPTVHNLIGRWHINNSQVACEDPSRRLDHSSCSCVMCTHAHVTTSTFAKEPRPFLGVGKKNSIPEPEKSESERGIPETSKPEFYLGWQTWKPEFISVCSVLGPWYLSSLNNPICSPSRTFSPAHTTYSTCYIPGHVSK